MDKDLLAKALEQTKSNITKPRGASGTKTYIDRIVSCLLDKKGNPSEPKTRHEIIAEVSLGILLEKRQKQIEEEVEGIQPLDLDSEADQAELAAINKKVKNQVNTAVSNSNNSQAISYNEKYKDVWEVCKENGKIYLIAKSELEAETEEESEA